MKKLVSILLFAAFLAGCSQPSELHKSMEEMEDALKAMKEGDNLDEIKKELEAFKNSLDKASLEKVKEEHQKLFDEGMRELKDAMGELKSSLNGSELDEFKRVLKKFGELRKEYHEELGVKKD